MLDEHTRLRLADATRGMKKPNDGDRYNESIVEAYVTIISYAIFNEGDPQIAKRIADAIRNDRGLIWDGRNKALKDAISSETAALRLVQALDEIAGALSSAPP